MSGRDVWLDAWRGLRSRPLRGPLTIALVAALLVAAAAATAAWLIASSHQAAVERAEQQAQRAVHAGLANLNRSLLGVDVLLATVDDLLQLSTLADGEIDRPRASLLLRGGVEQNLLVRYLALLTPLGQVIASSDRAGPQLDASMPEGYLESILQQPVYSVVISAPLKDPEDGEDVLYMGRTTHLHGGGKVVAVVKVQAQLLSTLMAQGSAGDGTEVALEYEDRQLLASSPRLPLGAPRGPRANLHDILASHAVARMPGRLSGQPSFVAARHTLYRNTVIAVSIPVATALAPWQQQRTYVLSSTGIIIAIILTTAGFAAWYMNRLGQVAQSLAQSKGVLDQSLNSMDSGFLLLDADGRAVNHNRRFDEIFTRLGGSPGAGLLYADAFAQIASRLLPEADEAARRAWVERRLEGHRLPHCEYELTLPDGQVIVVSERRTPDAGRVCVFRDITDERRAEIDLRVAAASFESQEGMLVTDAGRRILRVNRAFTKITGYDARDAVGRNPRMLGAGGHDPAFFDEMWREIDDKGTWQGEVLSRRKSGQVYHQHLTITAVKDDGGCVTHYVGNLIDVSQRRTAADKIERLAFYDPLTELPNRRLLMDRLQRALVESARNLRHGGLLFLDLDNFKMLNDTLGHGTGDQLLRLVSKRLLAATREADTVARLGGDEFVVLLKDLGETPVEAASELKQLGGKLLDALSLPYELDGHRHHCTSSIGAVLFNGKQESLDDLLKQADLAMYDAKTAGRNALRFFDPQMQASMSARAELEKSLRQALAEQQFELHYQPQMTHAGHVVGVEALIRWRHPERGMVSPMEFIPLAEETGLIVPIGQWVLRTACAQLQRWQADPVLRHLRLAVNVSARQFIQPEFVAQVCDVLAHSGADADRLELELTESLVLGDVGAVVAKMHALKARGVRFSMDDFGTGQSSLSYLTKLPLDQLKIDQSFVRNIGIRPTDALMVQTIIGMASNLGLEIIAEGVETQAQRAFLEEHGCALCQGYLFGRPMPLADLEHLLGQAVADTAAPSANVAAAAALAVAP